MAGHQPWKNPDDFLYHYTTTAGLIGILTSQNIWLTNAGFLNDSEELAHGAGHAVKQLRSQAKNMRSSSKNQDIDNHIADTLEDIANSIESINAPNAERFKFPYIASFSKERDDLSQWRGYASDGYCIAFHRDSLKRYITPAAEDAIPGIGQNIPILDEVRYGEEAGLYLKNHISHVVIPALKEHGCPAPPEGVSTYQLVKQLMKPPLTLTKHPAFQAENEWRIYVIDGGPVKFRNSPQGPVPYVEVKFNIEAIAEIIVAPGANSHRRKRAAEELLINSGYKSVPVNLSDAPFIP